VFVLAVGRTAHYDTFESAVLDTSLWNLTGSPKVNASTYHLGAQALRTKSFGSVENISSSIGLNNYIGSTGQYVISFWVFFNATTSGNAAPSDDVAPGLGNLTQFNSGQFQFLLDGGYPTANQWGYNNGGAWTSSGVSTISGDGAVVNMWVNIRMMINNDAHTVSVLWGNGTSPQLVNLSYVYTSQPVQKIFFDPTVGASPDVSWDDVDVWSWNPYGWVNPSRNCTTWVVDCTANTSLQYISNTTDNLYCPILYSGAGRVIVTGNIFNYSSSFVSGGCQVFAYAGGRV
jgi:hypothetical protein